MNKDKITQDAIAKETREQELVLYLLEQEMHKIIYNLHEERWDENECQRLLEVLTLRNKIKENLKTP